MNVRYRVELSQAERDQLTAMLRGGHHAARKLKRAQILLAADGGATDAAIAASVGVGESTVYRTKRRFVEGNLELALSEEPRAAPPRKLSGKEEALLVATACSSPPQGRARWTLELLAGEMVRLTDHSGLSRETVRRRLAENELKPWRQDMWCIPEVDGTYVARMEDVLDLYAEPPDPKRPVICFGHWNKTGIATSDKLIHPDTNSRRSRKSVAETLGQLRATLLLPTSLPMEETFS
jgi:transposase